VPGRQEDDLTKREQNYMQSVLTEYDTFKELFEDPETRKNPNVMKIQLQIIEQKVKELKNISDNPKIHAFGDAILGGCGLVYKGYLESDVDKIKEGIKLLKSAKSILKGEDDE
jgi:hypothetical protein